MRLMGDFRVIGGLRDTREMACRTVPRETSFRNRETSFKPDERLIGAHGRLEALVVSPRRRSRGSPSSLKFEGLRDEHRHLSARVVRQGAVVAATAAAGDLLGRELLDPVRER